MLASAGLYIGATSDSERSFTSRSTYEVFKISVNGSHAPSEDRVRVLPSRAMHPTEGRDMSEP